MENYKSIVQSTQVEEKKLKAKIDEEKEKNAAINNHVLEVQKDQSRLLQTFQRSKKEIENLESQVKGLNHEEKSLLKKIATLEKESKQLHKVKI